MKAVALVTGEAYEKVRTLMAELGRKNGRGTNIAITKEALAMLGKTNERVSALDFISKYPAGHRDILKNVTSYHPARFPEAWKDGKRYLMFTSGHVLAVVDGVAHDWTASKAKRARFIWEIK